MSGSPTLSARDVKSPRVRCRCSCGTEYRDVHFEQGFPMPQLIVLAALFGLVIGSFLNVVICRVPLAESLISPASHCPSCFTPIRARHNIPVLGWLILRGRCADCRTAIS